MMALGPCVAVELATPPAALYSAAVLEARCDAILGKGRCRIVGGGGGGPGASDVGGEGAPAEAGSCWSATVTTTGTGPAAATIVLRDSERRDHSQVEHSVTFRPHDAPVDRWATMGLLIAALVTIEQHSVAGSGTGDSPGGQPPAGPGVGAAPAPTDATLASAPSPAPTSAPGPPLAWELRAAAVLAAGVSPGLAWGTRVELTAARSHLVAAVRFTYLPAQTRVGPSDASRGGQFRLVSAGAGGCWLGDRDARLTPRLCAGGEVNTTLARGFGIAEPAAPSAVWGAAWVGGGVQLRVHTHVALFAGVDGSLAVRRPAFAIEGGNPIFTPAPVGGVASLGLAATY